ncbi:carbohydrate ABC transporter permease, partial [Candidatus Bathyarchaeota archaeon]|nr:carbohydrate ABC transporter permease [Candidatus Bathyarchaeota archaeon]
LIPLYKVYQTLHLMDSYIGLILLYQLIGVPFVVWMTRSYFLDVPRSIEEASLIDGYTPWQTFWRVTFPLTKGRIAATGVLTFIFEWNNFVFALVVGGKRTMPVTTGALGFISYEAVLWGQMAAAIIISAIPEIIIAIMVQKYMVRGLTFGAVRG